MLDGRGHRPNQLEHLQHDRRAADDAVHAEAILKLGAQVGVLGLQPPFFHRGMKIVEQLFELKRLGDEPFGAEPGDLDGLAHRRKAGNDDGDDVRVAGERLVEHLPAVHPRQPEVGDEDVEGELVQPLERVFPARRLFDPEPVFRQPIGNGLTKSRLVVNEQKMLEWRFGHRVVAVF